MGGTVRAFNCIALVVALIHAGAAALLAQGPQWEGRRVAEVRVVTDAGAVLETNSASLPLQPGQSFDFEAERQSMRILNGSGDFANIRAVASEDPAGLHIDFIVTQNLYVNIVRVEGLREPPSETVALSALALQLGYPFRSGELTAGLQRLSNLLRNEGFYHAKIDPTLTPHAETRQMDILLNVSPGPRGVVGRVGAANQTPFTADELIRRAKVHPGNSITTERLNRGGERLRKYLIKQGYLGARVGFERGTYDEKANSMPVTYSAYAGPKIRVEATGAKVSKKKLKTLVPVFAEGAVDDDLLQEGRRNLLDYFEREGYFDAQVSYTMGESDKPPERVISYHIDRGSRQKLTGVAFHGNHYFSATLLAGRLLIQPAEFLSPGRFSRVLLAADQQSLLGLYQANGFREATVNSEVISDYQGHSGRILVKFEIFEGPQTLVQSLSIEGNRALTDEQLSAVVGSTPGQPYSEFNVASDRDNILAIYFNEGFPKANFTADAAEDKASHRVRLTYHIIEGEQVHVRDVLLAGYKTTRRRVIARQVEVKPEQPLREGEVIATQRNLYNLGVFSSAAVAPQNPDGTDPEKAVVVAVEEGKRYTIGYGFGFEVQNIGGVNSSPAGNAVSASPRGIFEVTRANFLGRAETVSLKVRASTLQYRGLISYNAPNFLNFPKLTLTLNGFADKNRNVQTFTATRYEGSLEVAQRLSRITTITYRYAYRHVLVDASSLKVPPEEIPLFSQPTRVSLFGGNWLRDRRDNPADATRGQLYSVDLNVAAKDFGSSAAFVRLFLQNSSFHPLGRTLSFARSFRFGVEPPLSDTNEVNVPLPERFFAGGGGTLRGFGLNQAGPRDPTTGFPIGGLAVLMLNNEIRFPMRLPFVGSRVGGAIFYDGGNVFSDFNHINLRWKSPSPSELNYFSHTVGMGFRYATPIGPVRLDLGYLLNPATFTFQSTSGQPESARLPRFQFSFSIGSVF